MMQEPLLDAPVPGMSLTHELGARPWQTPPKAPTVAEAIDTYLPAFEDEDVIPQLLNVLESGIPVATIAEATMLGGVMEGRHTVDVGILILPFLMEMISFVADSADIEYDMGVSKVASKAEELTPPTNQEIAAAKKRMGEVKEDVQEIVVEEPVQQEEPKGLMARRK
jgi:hypothetical protein